MYDLLIKGGRLIDPASGIDGPQDVAFAGGRVAEIAADIEEERAREVVRADGRLVAPGLIDLHTHVYWGATSLSVAPEPVGRRSGCTTLVDAGSAGPGNFHGFRAFIAEQSGVRVLSYLNISYAGIFAFSGPVMVGECADLRLLNAKACLDCCLENRDLIVGLKVRVGHIAGGTSGIAPLDIALEVADAADLPIMTHIDFPPPSRAEILQRLRPGDILTHCFRPFPNAPVHGDGRLRDDMAEARERGVIFDIGHGMGGFAFGPARSLLEQGFPPDVISSDVHVLSEHGPAFDLITTGSKYLAMGMPLYDVIAAMTQRPAAALRRPELGSLAVDTPGDAVVLEEETGRFEFREAVGETLQSDRRLAAREIIVGGTVWHSANQTATTDD